jgi:hypothetical protein
MPTPDKVEMLARALGVNVGWLTAAQGRMRAADLEADRAAYREQGLWWFRPAPPDGGRDYGNANIWSFDVKLEALVREVLQNARDAATPPTLWSSGVMSSSDIRLAGDDCAYREPRLDGSAYPRSSSTGGQKLATLIRDGLRHVAEKNELLLLCIEDSGTTGLIGPEKDTGKFTALCRNNLDSNKDDAGTKGGAFGLGKAVLWRASRLSTVLFCSHLSRPDNGQAEFRLLGRCELPWHQTAGKAFAGPGWFGRRDDDGEKDALSFWENQTLRATCIWTEGKRYDRLCCRFPRCGKRPAQTSRSPTTSSGRRRTLLPALFFGTLSVRVEVCDGGEQYEQRTPDTASRLMSKNYSHTTAACSGQRKTGHGRSFEDNSEVVCKPVALTVSKHSRSEASKEHPALLLVATPATIAPRVHQPVGDVPRSWHGDRGGIAGRPGSRARPFALLLCGRAPTRPALRPQRQRPTNCRVSALPSRPRTTSG